MTSRVEPPSLLPERGNIPLTSFRPATNMPEAHAKCGRGSEQDEQMASFTNNLEVAIVRTRRAAGDLPTRGGMSVPGEGRHH